ncbi:MAG: hypothetical protein K2X03_20930 [Bryobacteraceae bacterium]|nr:hypothetical protein [Bryobacteraceae bacterium]
MPYRQALRDFCLECQAWFPENGTFVDFAWELIQESGEPDIYRQHVLGALPTSQSGSDAQKLFALAGYFAADGDQEMRDAMYANFRPDPRYADGVANSFIVLDGLRGLLFIAREIGAAMAQSTQPFDLGWSLSVAESRLGEEATLGTLREAADRDADIARYLAHSSSSPEESAQRSKPVTFADLAALAAREPGRVWSAAYDWGRKAKPAELALAAEALLAATQEIEQGWLLVVFGTRPFPGNPHRLIELARSSNPKIASAARSALGQMSHPTVRAFAIELARAEAIGLLRNNYQPGDHALILRWLRAATDYEAVHAATRHALNFLDLHRDPADDLAILRHIYEFNPCAFCREQAVSRMIKLQILLLDVAAECAFDASQEIRDLVT